MQIRSIENVAAVFHQILKKFRMKTSNCRYFWRENLSHKIEYFDYKIISKVRYFDRCFKIYFITIIL